jgi:hypothetical protein
MDNWNMEFQSRIGSSTGTVFVDDIKFEYIPDVPIVIDNFNDMVGENGLGGSLYKSSGGGATITTAYDTSNRYGSNGAAYRIVYGGVTSSSWATAGSDLMSLNASAYKFLSFYVKGGHGGERPNIYLVSRVGTTQTRKYIDLEKYAKVTTSWRRVYIPLNDFSKQGIDLANLAYLEIVFEWADMAGTMYLDNIELSTTQEWDYFLPGIFKGYKP